MTSRIAVPSIKIIEAARLRSSIRIKSRGFTTLELVVTLLFVAILSSAALINLSAQLQRQKLKASAQSMVDWLQERRRQAMVLQDASTKGKGVCLITVDPATATLSTPASGQVLGSSGSSINVVNLCQTERSLDFQSMASGSTSIQLTIVGGSTADNQALQFSYRGTSPTSREYRIMLPQMPEVRCIKVMAPLGLIKTGLGSSSSSSCNYQDQNLGS